MALSFPQTRIEHSYERPVVAGSTVTAEGQALVAAVANGVAGVKPSAGTSGEIFAGFAIAQQLTLTQLPNIETLTVTAGLTVTTALTPVSGSLRVYNVTRAAEVAAGTDAGNYAIAGNVITIVTAGATVAGDVLTVSYRFVPTTVQAQMVQGDIPPGGAASLTLGSVGVISAGELHTTEFDTTVDWAASNPVIKLGANGRLTIGGSGTTINALITKLPTSGDAVLGIKFQAN